MVMSMGSFSLESKPPGGICLTFSRSISVFIPEVGAKKEVVVRKSQTFRDESVRRHGGECNLDLTRAFHPPLATSCMTLDIYQQVPGSTPRISCTLLHAILNSLSSTPACPDKVPVSNINFDISVSPSYTWRVKLRVPSRSDLPNEFTALACFSSSNLVFPLGVTAPPLCHNPMSHRVSSDAR